MVRGPASFTPHRRGLSEAVREKYQSEELADLSFNLPYGCYIALGADAEKMVFLGLPHADESRPYAQKTIFGWVMFGPIAIQPGVIGH